MFGMDETSAAADVSAYIEPYRIYGTLLQTRSTPPAAPRIFYISLTLTIELDKCTRADLTAAPAADTFLPDCKAGPV